MRIETLPLPIQVEIILQDFEDQLNLTRKFNEKNPQQMKSDVSTNDTSDLVARIFSGSACFGRENCLN